MIDFELSMPTRIFFGRDKLGLLPGEIKKHSDRVLLVYGKSSIKANGLYGRITRLLKENGIFFQELAGVKPNPDISSVHDGMRICREKNINFILAVGGGSVIDCSKAIAAGVFHKGDPWDLFTGHAEVKNAMPIGAILTLAATGSEANGNAVVSNRAASKKLVISSDLLVPKFSFLDPELTFSVSKYQTAAGVVDIFSHVLEQYFGPVADTFVQDRMAEALLNTCKEFGPAVIAKPRSYEARAMIMWTSTLALFGFLDAGKYGDWASHAIEHAVSGMYDNVTHGAGLAVIQPAWMKYVLDKTTMPKFLAYATNVWGIEQAGGKMEAAMAGIQKTKEFFVQLSMPARLRELGVAEDKLPLIAAMATEYGTIGSLRGLDKNDVLEILRDAY
jgi:hypothetical protein